MDFKFTFGNEKLSKEIEKPWRKVDPRKRVTRAESTLTSGSYEKRVVPVARAKRARACSDHFA